MGLRPFYLVLAVPLKKTSAVPSANIIPAGIDKYSIFINKKES